MASESIRRELLRWFVAIVFTLPVAAFYIGGHYIAARQHDRVPTGFIQYDQPYYMANARQHFDDGFGLFYSNPYDPDLNSPRIYTQPQTFLLGIAHRVSGLDPGIVFVVFGAIAAISMMRVSIALFENVFSLTRAEHWLALGCFAWGGGILTVASVLPNTMEILRNPYHLLASHVFSGLDPFQGWWFLNLGRNAIYPLEAYYHVVAFAAIVMVLKQRYGPSFLLLALISWSHPFTGLEFLAIAVTWTIVERYIGNSTVPRYFGYGLLLLLFTHVWYYLIFLNSFSSHKILSEFWRMDWSYQAISFVPAYAIVGGMFLWQVRSPQKLQLVFQSPQNRLYFVWFMLAFLLANHEFALKPPAQPLHFTRGYIWTPLFLLGGPTLIEGFSYVRARFSRFMSIAVIGTVVLTFCADNIVWFSMGILRPTVFNQPIKIRGIHLSPQQMELMQWLSTNTDSEDLIISNVSKNFEISIPTYTSARVWCGHENNTPYYEKKREDERLFYENGVIPEEWRGRNLFIVAKTGEQAEFVASRFVDREPIPVLQNSDYALFQTYLHYE